MQDSRVNEAASTRGRWLAWSSPNPGANYLAQLDGLRALAIAGVLYSHFFDAESIAGVLGVRLFFVLSGYLITRMLLDARNAGLSVLPNFYIRRALRLWPAFYLALGTAVIFDVEGIRAVAWWHASYASNILFALRDDYVPWVTAGWWSLAVEEQFYLVWPFVVVLASRQALPWICIAAICGSAVFTATVQSFHGSEQMYLLLPGALDGLAGGGLLAIARQSRPKMLRLLPVLGLASAGLGLALVALALKWGYWAGLFLALVASCALVNLASTDRDWIARRLLASRPAVFIGRISYGIYLYHFFVWWGLMQLFGHHPATQRGWFLLVAGSLLCVALATLSWFAIEMPANRLKSRFSLPRATFGNDLATTACSDSSVGAGSVTNSGRR
jgi:peptidoglycan/LPS O-acetylase OafA/YrhL